MFGFLQFLQKRPSDRTIIIGRIIFGLIIIASLYYNFFYQATPNIIENSFWGIQISDSAKMYIKYIMIALGIVPLLLGILNICLLKKKYVRILQIIFAILLFISAGLIVDTPTLDVDALLIFLGFLPLFAGITGKCITKKCLKYGEKIKKIRV